MITVPCFLCGEQLRKRVDKNSKPYLVCDGCGLQAFIRGSKGIENLAELVATLRKHNLPFVEHALTLHEIQAILSEIRGVKKELASLDSIFALFSEDEHAERTRKLLNARVENLLSRLEEIATREIQTSQ